MVSPKTRNRVPALTGVVLAPSRACPNIDQRKLRPNRTSRTMSRTTTTTAHLRVPLSSFEDTASSRAANDNQHSASMERQREELAISYGCRHSAASRMSATTTISQEEENWIRMRLPFAVDDHLHTRRIAGKMMVSRNNVSPGYTMAAR